MTSSIIYMADRSFSGTLSSCVMPSLRKCQTSHLMSERSQCNMHSTMVISLYFSYIILVGSFARSFVDWCWTYVTFSDISAIYREKRYVPLPNQFWPTSRQARHGQIMSCSTYLLNKRRQEQLATLLPQVQRTNRSAIAGFDHQW